MSFKPYFHFEPYTSKSGKVNYKFTPLGREGKKYVVGAKQVESITDSKTGIAIAVPTTNKGKDGLPFDSLIIFKVITKEEDILNVIMSLDIKESDTAPVNDTDADDAPF